LGVTRVVLPRHLTAGEACALAPAAKAEGVELEAFVLNALCPYIDGLCTLQHFGASTESISANELACRMPFDVEVFSGEGEPKKRAAKSRACFWQNTLPASCGLCALPLFEKAGIHSLKIAGRGNSTEKKVSDVKMLRHALSLLPKLPEGEFRAEMHGLFFAANRARCGFNSCYYADAGLP
jgi:collagenase-like PrtC family protease